MSQDLCLPCNDGILNIRVGAIIMRDGKILMAGNENANYLYSVGGRIKFGETAKEAVIRLLKAGASVELVSKAFPSLSIDDIKQLEQQELANA